MPEQAAGSGVERTRPRGRRSGGEDSRDQIIAGARAEFAERGYDGGSVRSIARRAGVDPALVRYYFEGGKAELFSTALVDWGVNPARIVGELVAGPLETLGPRMIEALLTVWDAPGRAERFRLIFTAAAAGQEATIIRDYLTRQVFGRLSTVLTGPDIPLRLNLVASHVAGVLVGRYLLRFEPLASTPADEVARVAGPVLQRYVQPG